MGVLAAICLRNAASMENVIAGALSSVTFVKYAIVTAAWRAQMRTAGGTPAGKTGQSGIVPASLTPSTPAGRNPGRAPAHVLDGTLAARK